MEIYIDDKEKYDASAAANSFTQKEVKNRAYINTLGAELAIKYLLSENIDVSNLHNIHSIKKVLEEIDISDIILSNIHMDVRVVFDENAIFIPKSHFEYNLVPDIYLVFHLADDFSHVKFLGFFEPKLINKNNANSEYYFIEKEKLNSPSDFVNYIKTHKNETERNLSQEEIENSEKIMISMADNEISENDKKYLISQLVKSSQLRDKFIEFENFEILSSKAMIDDNIVKKFPITETIPVDEFEEFDALETDNSEIFETIDEANADFLPFEEETPIEQNNLEEITEQELMNFEEQTEDVVEPELMPFEDSTENITEPELMPIEDSNEDIVEPELLPFEDSNENIAEPELMPFEDSAENITEPELLPFEDSAEDIAEPELLPFEDSAEDIAEPELLPFEDSNEDTTEAELMPFEESLTEEISPQIDTNNEIPDSDIVSVGEILDFENINQEIAVEDVIQTDEVPNYEEIQENPVMDDYEDIISESDSSHTIENEETFGKNLLENLSQQDDVEIEASESPIDEFLSQADNIIDISSQIEPPTVENDEIPSVDELLNDNSYSENKEEDKLNILYNEETPQEQIIEDEITEEQVPEFNPKPANSSNKKTLVTAAALVTVLGAVSAFALFKPKNDMIETQNPISPSNETITEKPSDNILEANAPVINKPISKEQTKTTVKELKNTPPKTSASEPYMTVNRLVWDVPDTLSYSTKMQNYLRTAGKSIKLSLSADLLLATEYAYTNQVKVGLRISKDGSVQDAVILSGSGSSQIDNIVLQSVKNTLSVVKPPSEEINTPNFNLNLIIYF